MGAAPVLGPAAEAAAEEAAKQTTKLIVIEGGKAAGKTILTRGVLAELLEVAAVAGTALTFLGVLLYPSPIAEEPSRWRPPQPPPSKDVTPCRGSAPYPLWEPFGRGQNWPDAKTEVAPALERAGKPGDDCGTIGRDIDIIGRSLRLRRFQLATGGLPDDPGGWHGDQGHIDRHVSEQDLLRNLIDHANSHQPPCPYNPSAEYETEIPYDFTGDLPERIEELFTDW